MLVDTLKSSNEELKIMLQGSLVDYSSMENLTLENRSLKNEVDKLKATNSKFEKCKGALDDILLSQRSPSIKHGLGYRKASTINPSPKTVFIKSSNIQSSSIDIDLDNLEKRRNF